MVSVDETQNAADGDFVNVKDSPSNLKSKKEYEAPVLECYTDMQELLLLDPIHEVEETNWLVNKPQ